MFAFAGKLSRFMIRNHKKFYLAAFLLFVQLIPAFANCSSFTFASKGVSGFSRAAFQYLLSFSLGALDEPFVPHRI